MAYLGTSAAGCMEALPLPMQWAMARANRLPGFEGHTWDLAQAFDSTPVVAIEFGEHALVDSSYFTVSTN